MIDDALHLGPCIMRAMKSFMPHMADDFLYFVEDNARVHKKIRKAYPGLDVRSYKYLTVVSP